jgi:ferrous iron transport protein B
LTKTLPKIALVGNPNAGKSSLFNALTGLRQKVGNFPGVTVDKKTGTCILAEGLKTKVIDLPGTYSLYPKSDDERVATEVLLSPHGPDAPDVVIVVVDASNLKRNLLFATQIMDLRRPTVVALTMLDLAATKGITINTEALERQLGVPVIGINPRRGKGIAELRKTLIQLLEGAGGLPAEPFIDSKALAGDALVEEVRQLAGLTSDYAALQLACAGSESSFLNAAQRIQLPAILDLYKFSKSKVQAAEVVARYDRIGKMLPLAVREDTPAQKRFRTEQIDKILLHPLWGNLILLFVLFLLFQSIFWLAAYPMDWVEGGMAWLTGNLAAVLPAGWLTDLFLNGVLAGFGGIVIFIPQIAILFGAITILEDSGYMARISFLTDRLMRSVGLNGRSVMPLISGMACAVPAVMAARTIANKKERLITILVTPLMSCSARLPVYTILIGLVIPDKRIGILTLQGLVLMGLYLLGFVGALLVSKILSWTIKMKERTFFLMELPYYRAPRWKNVATTMVEKAKVFVVDAGKVILVISILLWGLSSFGPARNKQGNFTIAPTPLEASYAGKLGHFIEPAIRPLGYDWKIGIALVTSFAAREVFVGTMATLYSVDAEDSAAGEQKLRTRMAGAKRADGTPVYTLASGVSLLIFYVFAMQCMSTMAIVKRETRSWLIPAFQFLYMGVMAWIGAWIAFSILG